MCYCSLDMRYKRCWGGCRQVILAFDAAGVDHIVIVVEDMRRACPLLALRLTSTRRIVAETAASTAVSMSLGSALQTSRMGRQPVPRQICDLQTFRATTPSCRRSPSLFRTSITICITANRRRAFQSAMPGFGRTLIATISGRRLTIVF